MSQAKPKLPADVNQFGLTSGSRTASPLLVVSLYSPKGTYDALFSANYATINVNDALTACPASGRVHNFGAADYAMRIWVNPDQLAKLGLTVADLSNAVQAQSTVNPAGQIGAEPAPKGQEFTYTVRAQGRLVTPEEFGNIVVRVNPDGSVVRMKDVARVELGASELQADRPLRRQARRASSPSFRPRARTRCRRRKRCKTTMARAARALPR